MSKKQDEMAEDLTKITGILLKDESTGFVGYISVIRDLVIRVRKLENIKKIILGFYGILCIVIGWIIKSFLIDIL